MSNESTASATSKYKAIARIGSGGMADIYLTEVAGPSGFRKLSVVKRLRPEDAEDEEMVRMFLDEARLAARLNHPNIVNTFEVGSDESGHYIAMEYLEGQPLDRVLRRLAGKADFPLPLQLHVLCQVLAALQYAHELRDYDQSPLGIVHRDVSPHNIFVLYSGQSKLVDFGIAKSANALGRTRAGAIKGKFAYMAPEQARAEPVDPRTDVFSVGLVLWEALTQRRVWAGMGESQILHALLSDTPLPRPSDINPDVPPALERVCMEAIALRPDSRFANAAEFESALEEAMNELGMRVSTRDVARALETTFGPDRARLRDEVEAFIRRASPVEALPVLAFEAGAGSSSGSGASRPRGGSYSNSHARATATPGSNVIRVLAIVAALAVAVAVGAVIARPREHVVATPPPAQSAATPPPTPTLPATSEPSTAAREIRLELNAFPATAEIFLDDVPVPNPFRARRTADGSSHVVRVSERGYTTQTRRIELKGDINLDVALSPLPNYVQQPPPRLPPRGKTQPAPPASARTTQPSNPTSDAPPPARPPQLDDPLTPPPPKKPREGLDPAPW